MYEAQVIGQSYWHAETCEHLRITLLRLVCIDPPSWIVYVLMEDYQPPWGLGNKSSRTSYRTFYRRHHADAAYLDAVRSAGLVEPWQFTDVIDQIEGDPEDGPRSG